MAAKKIEMKGIDLAERAARVFWTEMERLDPGIDPESPNTWDEVDEPTRDLYVRAMRRALADIAADEGHP